jgi:hypothetical protein
MCCPWRLWYGWRRNIPLPGYREGLGEGSLSHFNLPELAAAQPEQCTQEHPPDYSIRHHC